MKLALFLGAVLVTCVSADIDCGDLLETWTLCEAKNLPDSSCHPRCDDVDTSRACTTTENSSGQQTWPCIDKNSCIGDEACRRTYMGKSIGKDSCYGKKACNGSSSPNIGLHACIGEMACQSSFGDIRDNSCICDTGDDDCTRTCFGAGDDIDQNSCHGNQACENVDGTVRKDACHGDHSCFEAAGKIDALSCNGKMLVTTSRAMSAVTRATAMDAALA